MITLAEYLHQISPFLIKFPDGFFVDGIRWYGLSYVAGFLCAWGVLLWLSNRHRTYMSPKDVADFTFISAAGIVIGGRLGYVIFYAPHLLYEFGESFPFWGVLAMNQGGMASHGGMIGMVLACLFFAWRRRLLILHLMDMIVIAAPLGVFFGRIANFINGELYGRIAEKWHAVPWAMKFPQELIEWVRFPDPTKDADWYSPGNEQRLKDLYDGINAVTVNPIPPQAWDMAVTKAMAGDPGYQGYVEQNVRLLENNWANSPIAVEVLQNVIPARHPSQLYAAGLEGLLLLVVLWAVWFKPRKTGVVAGWCIVTYAVVRIFNEFFRQPDAHLGLQALDLTRGQQLSIVMLLAGLAFLIWASLRKAERVCGWGPAGVEVVQTDERDAAEAEDQAVS